MRGASRSQARSTSSAASPRAKLTGTAIARAVCRESLIQVNTTAASTVPVACDAFHNRPASSAKTRAPPGDWRRDCWVERPCMEVLVGYQRDLAMGLAYVKGWVLGATCWVLRLGGGLVGGGWSAISGTEHQASAPTTKPGIQHQAAAPARNHQPQKKTAKQCLAVSTARTENWARVSLRRCRKCGHPLRGNFRASCPFVVPRAATSRPSGKTRS